MDAGVAYVLSKISYYAHKASTILRAYNSSRMTYSNLAVLSSSYEFPWKKNCNVLYVQWKWHNVVRRWELVKAS